MQKIDRLSIFALFIVFFYLFSLPGMFIKEAFGSEIEELRFENSIQYCKPDATEVDVRFQTVDQPTIQAIIDDADPLSDDLINDENSFFAGFLDAIKERYPFGDDNYEALINIGEDALIVVLGIGITIVITGITSALAAAGAASAGTVLVAVLIAGVAIGLVFAIGSIISEYLKGNKREAGARTFNLVRELILLLAGGAIAGKAFASKTANQAIRFAKYLENKIPEAMSWLRQTVNPICNRFLLWAKDIPFKLGLFARGKKPTALEVFVEKGNFTEVEISHLYRDPSGNTALWKASEDPELVLLSFNDGIAIKPTYNQARISLRGGNFELVESNIKMSNPEGQIVLWKKHHIDPNQDYIRIKGGDYNSKSVSSDDALAMYSEAASAEIRLNPDGTITKKFNELEGGILLADPAHEARMMKIWEEINPSSSPILLEEGPNFIRMTQLNGKPLESFSPGELRLNPGAWDRFLEKVLRFHEEGYVFNDFGYHGRNVFVVDGELHILDFGLSMKSSSHDMRMELESLEETYKWLLELGIKDVHPVEVPPKPSTEAVSAGG